MLLKQHGNYIAVLCNGSTADSDSVCLGSNPGTAAKEMVSLVETNFFEVWLSLVERYVRDVEVAGSNPVTSTNFTYDRGQRTLYVDLCFIYIDPVNQQTYYFIICSVANNI